MKNANKNNKISAIILTYNEEIHIDRCIKSLKNFVKEIIQVLTSDLNFFSIFILEFSEDMPFFYGLFSIMFAILLGIGAALIRKFFSSLRKKYKK